MLILHIGRGNFWLLYDPLNLVNWIITILLEIMYAFIYYMYYIEIETKLTKNKYLNKKNLLLNLLQDFSNYDVEMFQNGNINISGFRIINREAKEYSNLKNAIFKMEKINIDNEVI